MESIGQVRVAALVGRLADRLLLVDADRRLGLGARRRRQVALVLDDVRLAQAALQILSRHDNTKKNTSTLPTSSSLQLEPVPNILNRFSIDFVD